MSLQSYLENWSFLLSEAAIAERLRQVDGIDLHPTLFDAPLIYEPWSKGVLAGMYREYISIAQAFRLPILIAAPTWRLDQERVLATEEVPSSINHDAAVFIREVREQSGYEHVMVAGLLAPKNDCYDAGVALSADESEAFHTWQAEELSDASLDLLLAQTIPSVSEAEGMARAMLRTGVPSVVSFCINRHGEVMDGTPLGDAIEQLDDRLDAQLLGYKINCSHPSFVKTESMSEASLSRLIGINANASSKDHAELEKSNETVADSMEEWVEGMVKLNRVAGVKILGGCCGTDGRYLRAMAEKITQSGTV